MSATHSVPVKVTEYGKARREAVLEDGKALVLAFLASLDIETEQRRVAVNGFPADAKTTVIEGDEITVHPFVQGG